MSGSKGSSSHFALALVQLAERRPLLEFATVRRQFHFPPSFEFKYHKTKSRHRDAFFHAIRPIPFRVRAVLVSKTRIENEFKGRKGNDLLIDFIARLSLRASPLDIAKDILIIDGTTPVFRRTLRVRISEECRRSDRVQPFSKIISGDSRREDGLQLADMIIGSLRDYVLGLKSEYFQTFSEKVVDLWQVL